MFKLSHAFLGAASLAALSVGVAQAQDGGFVYRPDLQVQELPAQATARPKYMIRATTLYANDETGSDWAGADEIYAEFVLRRPDRLGSEEFFARTSVFHDFDTGETKRFRDGENCLTGVMPAPVQEGNSPVRFWNCHPDGDRYNLQFQIKLYEEDTGDDDLIGQRTVRWTQAELDGLNLGVGQKSSERIRIGGYTMTWEIERVS